MEPMWVWMWLENNKKFIKGRATNTNAQQLSDRFINVVVWYVHANQLDKVIQHVLNNRDAQYQQQQPTNITNIVETSSKPIASPYILYNIVCISNRKRYEAFVRYSLCSLRFKQTKLAFKSNETVNST